eukprot:CAMPEP_0115258092 /NCGR_PEP_ID=MMETSP0270-20121206/47112_1 /TAXON_ID=71861 /ORGANISM="Scrippsiella trochoidea, Strain CCMP3099" /LENGTH=666 /DNA_ID=CAMNT_0002673823 /DNA_START=62 /DNA_END=2065 /DNA_ORIENTATION=+
MTLRLLLLALPSACLATAPVPSLPRRHLSMESLAEDDACSIDAGSAQCSLSALQRHGYSTGKNKALREEATIAGEAKASRVHARRPLLWERLHPAADDVRHELIFTIKQLNNSKLFEMLLDRSTPGSPRFRKWLSREEALGITHNGPGMAAVRQVLEGIGATSLREIGKTFLRASAPIGVWRKLLDAQFFVFRRTDYVRGEVVRADSYLLPNSLFGHVDGILKLLQLDESSLPLQTSSSPANLTGMPQRMPPHHNAYAGQPASAEVQATTGCTAWPCDDFAGMNAFLGGAVVTPDKLRAAYNMPPVALEGSQEAQNRADVAQLVFSSLGQVWSPDDRLEFQQTFNLPVQNVTETDSGDHGSSKACRQDANSCAEANLDVQYMNAMSPWSKLELYYMDLTGDKEFDDFVVDLLDLDPMPHVVSISYGMPEAGATPDSVEAFDSTMAKLGLQGGTIVVSSGDDGAASSAVRSYGCFITDMYGLLPSWPASSAYVTGVGATMGVDTGSPEVVCSTRGKGETWDATPDKPLITSGGGYSLIEKVPQYQIGKIPEDALGRGVPDISLAGHAYSVVIGGKWLTVDGTSASSPAFAGMVSMINAQLKASGQPLVGFLNPALYASSAFNDITIGDNKCAAQGAMCCGGYDAAPGWDAASGLGTPDFKLLFAELT